LKSFELCARDYFIHHAITETNRFTSFIEKRRFLIEFDSPSAAPLISGHLRSSAIKVLFLSYAGVVSDKIGFNLSGESNAVVVIEASLDFQNWTPLATNTLGAGPIRFSDPALGELPKRFYRALARDWK